MSSSGSNVELTIVPKVVQLNAIRLVENQLFTAVDQLTLSNEPAIYQWPSQRSHSAAATIFIGLDALEVDCNRHN